MSWLSSIFLPSRKMTGVSQALRMMKPKGYNCWFDFEHIPAMSLLLALHCYLLFRQNRNRKLKIYKNAYFKAKRNSRALRHVRRVVQWYRVWWWEDQKLCFLYMHIVEWDFSYLCSCSIRPAFSVIKEPFSYINTRLTACFMIFHKSIINHLWDVSACWL